MKYSVGDSIKHKSKNRKIYYGFITQSFKAKTNHVKKTNYNSYFSTISKIIFRNENYLKFTYEEKEICTVRILLLEKKIFNEDTLIMMSGSTIATVYR